MWLGVMFRYHLVMHLCQLTTDRSLNIEHWIYGIVTTENLLDDYLLLKNPFLTIYYSKNPFLTIYYSKIPSASGSPKSR
jgi:hypothetical protein